ncbi:MAG: BMP family ABC transporter substrate-binding protein [Eubacteriales bacterium]|nr:BMP family ABC transporter substrate-binding protein [Eubacteriales bacterium]
MKKLVSLFLAATMALSMVACGGGTTSTTEEPAGEETSSVETQDKSSDGKYEIALVTDVGTIDDRSFNQGSWEGVVKYAEENGISHKYYQPAEKSNEAITASIELAIKGGAKTIVCPGFLFEVPVYNMQLKYPDVKFIIIDGEPKSSDGEDAEYVVAENTVAIYYEEQQAGFLAGYAAVKEGYRNLGFMGGIAVPAVIRFGYGFIQGADYAALELGLNKDDIKINYTYVGNFDSSPDNMAKASSWYNEGVEVIFACGGGVGNSVMKAAESIDGKKVIGVDVDQSFESETVITSAMKNLQSSVYEELKAVYDGTFEGGKILTLGADTNNVLLPMETSKFENFTQEDYDAIYAKVVNNEVEIFDERAGEDASDIPVQLISLNVQ